MTKPKSKIKKVDTDKDVSSSGTNSEIKAVGDTLTSTPSSAAQKSTPTAWFTTEIQAMMFGFGDCKKPLLESAKLIEEVVHQQCNSLLIQLAEIAMTRGARFIGLEDIVFLLRRDKVKLSRLIRYLTLKDLKNALLKGAEDVVEEIADYGGCCEIKIAAPLKKRRNVCKEFLSSIDQTGELMALFDDDIYDEVKQERDQRAELQTRAMDYNQYLEFAEARATTFLRRYRSTKFRDWLLKDNLTEIKPSTIALEILNYLTYETVAQIVDLALSVKQTSVTPSDDPVSQLMPPQCFNADYPSVRLHHCNKSPITAAGSTPPQSPRVSSPPSSPSSQFGSQSLTEPSTGSSSGSHQGATTSSSSSSKSKSKKRKKSGVVANPEPPSALAIQPSEIREALRRYWQPAGPLVPFAKANSSYMGKRLLCC